jgi:hypothetical protein
VSGSRSADAARAIELLRRLGSPPRVVLVDDPVLAAYAGAGEGERWRPGPPAPPEEARRAEVHLEALLSELAEAAQTPDRVGLVDRFHGAFTLFLQTGMVAPEVAADWAARLQRALGRTIDDLDLEHLGVDLDDLGDYEDEADPVEEPGAVLRVVPALPARHDGVCVTAIALRERGFDVYWHALRHDGADELEPDELGPERASDDLGTEYRELMDGGAGWSGRDGPFAVCGESRCPTSVPAGARELRLAKGEAEWVVPLG